MSLFARSENEFQIKYLNFVTCTNQPLIPTQKVRSTGQLVEKILGRSARPEMSFADFGRTYFNLDFSAFHISALA